MIQIKLIITTLCSCFFATVLLGTNSIPFEHVNGAVVVSATLNQQQHYFIIDTGAPGLVLNDTPMTNSANLTAEGITGGMAVEERDVASFVFGPIEKTNLKALAINMPHWEQALGFPVAGLIGLELLEQYEVFIDFDAEQITFYPIRRSKIEEQYELIGTSRMVLSEHVPVVLMKINGKKMRFGIDTGTEVNLLSPTVYNEMQSSFSTPLNTLFLRGLNGERRLITSRSLDQIALDDTEFTDIEFYVLDHQTNQKLEALNLDGILGTDFFCHYKFSLNYPKGKIYFWK